MKVVVLSPSKYSLYSLSIVQELRKKHVNVTGIGIRKLINFNRLITEGRRDGLRLLKKITTRLILRKHETNNGNEETILNYVKDNNLMSDSLEKYSKLEGIYFIFCKNFNQPGFVSWVEERDADAIVFTGGGLIKKKLLNTTKLGILNCHMGILPLYRGMDLPEWAILNEDWNSIGYAVHVMDSGVDTGPILKELCVPIEKNDNIAILREHIEAKMVPFFSNVIVSYLRGDLKASTQRKNEGKQFFKMTTELLEIAEGRLELYKELIN